MKSYLYDTHVHTSEVSPCGFVPGAEMVRLYKEAGYQGIIITDHYYNHYFNELGEIPWKEKADCYLSGFRAASEEGKRIGLKVILGIELSFQENNNNDYLIFGIDESFIYENPELYKMTLKTFRESIQGQNIFIFQAHPFRKGVKPAPPILLDGVEIFNANPRHESHNDLAYSFAKENNLIMLNGSDAHRIEDVGGGGIYLKEEISNSKEFAKLIKSKGYMKLYSKPL